jgi:hypothetical protein
MHFEDRTDSEQPVEDLIAGLLTARVGPPSEHNDREATRVLHHALEAWRSTADGEADAE